MADDRSDDFLVRFAGADLPWTQWIAWHLRAAGYSVVTESFDSPAHVASAPADSDADDARTIAVVSQRFLKWVRQRPEWMTALTKPSGSSERGVIIVRVEHCDLSELLGPAPCIDLISRSDEGSARTALLEGVRAGRPLPASAPSIPSGRLAVDRPRYPAALPSVWTVDHERHLERFVGRERQLHELEHRMSQPERAIQVVQGLGGVGKSRLAIEYAYRYRSQYRAVCWVRAGEPSTLVADYAFLATALDLRDAGNSDQKLVLAAVRRWFEENASWLLILDDARDPDGTIGEGPGFERTLDFAPRSGGGHVLVTTRDKLWERETTSFLAVDVLERQEAESFLLEHTTGLGSESARDLSHALGYLPLALEQARAYMASEAMTREEYADGLRQRSPEFFGKGDADDYQETVESTWKVSIDKVRARMPGAAELLEVFSYLDTEDIPRTALIHDYFPDLTSGLTVIAESFEAFREAVSELDRYALVQATTYSVSVHRLVQAVVRQTLPPEQQQARAAVAVSIIEALFPKDLSDQASWADCDRLVGHALSSTTNAMALNVELQRSADLFQRVMTYLDVRARYVEAQSHCEQMLSVVRAAYGDDAIEFAQALGLASEVLYELGDLHMALDMAERALLIGERTYGLDHPFHITVLSTLGLVLLDLGRLAEALQSHQRALRIGEARYGEDHPEVARVRSHLGTVFYEMGRRDDAKRCQELAHAVLSLKASEPAGQLVARRLAEVLYDRGKLQASKEALEAALTLVDSERGEHPQVAKTLQQLGFVLWDLGQLSDARGVFERAMAIFRQVYRRDHPAVASTLSGLALVLQDQGHLEQAYSHAERAFEISQSVFGSNHFQVASRMDSLGFILRNLGRREEACPYFEGAIDILTHSFDEGHPELGIPLSNFGLVLEELNNDLPRAQATQARAITIFESHYDADHFHIHLAYSRYAVILRKLGEFPEARRLLERALPMFEAAKGPNHPDVGRVREKLGLVFADMGHSDAALQQMQLAASLFKHTLGPDHPRTLLSQKLLATRRETFGSDHPDPYGR